MTTTNTMSRLRSGDDYLVPEWTLGDRMRKALEVSGTPIQEIADYLGVSRVTVGRWVHDRGPVKRSTLMIWAATTGVDLGWLETGTAGLENQTGRDQYAIRDLNPEPADMKSRRSSLRLVSVNRGLTVNRIPAGDLPYDVPRRPVGPQSGRHLTAVSA